MASAESAGETAVSTNGDDAPVQCNRIEFVDIDAAAKIGRGTVWSYLYTHESRQIALRSESTAALNQLASTIPVRLIAPFGYPGRSLGGIQIVGDDSRMPAYEVQLSQNAEQFGAVITQLALAPRSSKSLAVTYRFEPNLPSDMSVKRRRGSELLDGSITNPLPLDLLDAMLVYRNWAYLLPTRFRAGCDRRFGRFTASEEFPLAAFSSTRRREFQRDRSVESDGHSIAQPDCRDVDVS